jgi:hypothetical protein
MNRPTIHCRYVHCPKLDCAMRKRGRHCIFQRTLKFYFDGERDRRGERMKPNGNLECQLELSLH